MTAALQLQGLRRTHRGAAVPALAGLDLDVRAGDAVALLGPSGSGKTTVLRLVAGLDAPDSGDILIDGSSVLAVPPERRGIAMVSQRPLLFPHLSVTDNVAFAPRMAGASKRDARDQADRFLELVQLGGFGRRRPRTLSGGQQQRVALARALAAEPEVLLLDEPFSAVDPALRADMHQLLLELRAVLQPTILIVTHDHHEAALLADTIAVLIDGSLHQLSPAGLLYSRPESLTISRFLGGLNEIPGQLVDGRHRSALGNLQVASPCELRDGPSVMVVRQEAVRLVAASSAEATATGRIERVTPRGARLLVEVRTAVGSLFAEASPGHAVRAGDEVGLVLPVDQRAVVSGHADAGTPLSREGVGAPVR